MPKRSPYRGAQPAVELDEVILSGKLDETHSGTHRCDRQRRYPDDMEESGGARVIDESARPTGVDIRTRGFVGGTPSITLHGAGQNDLRVPVDGIDVTDTWAAGRP